MIVVEMKFIMIVVMLMTDNDSCEDEIDDVIVTVVALMSRFPESQELHKTKFPDFFLIFP